MNNKSTDNKISQLSTGPVPQNYAESNLGVSSNDANDDKWGKKEEEENWYDSPEQSAPGGSPQYQSRIPNAQEPSTQSLGRPSHIDVATFKAHKKIKAQVHAEMITPTR